MVQWRNHCLSLVGEYSLIVCLKTQIFSESMPFVLQGDECKSNRIPGNDGISCIADFAQTWLAFSVVLFSYTGNLYCFVFSDIYCCCNYTWIPGEKSMGILELYLCCQGGSQLRSLVAQQAFLDEEPCPLWSQALLQTTCTLMQLMYPCCWQDSHFFVAWRPSVMNWRIHNKQDGVVSLTQHFAAGRWTWVLTSRRRYWWSASLCSCRIMFASRTTGAQTGTYLHESSH